MNDRISLQEMVVRRLDAQFDSVQQDVLTILETTETELDTGLVLTLRDFLSLSQDYREFILKAQSFVDGIDRTDYAHEQVQLESQVIAKIVREWLSLRPIIVQRLAINGHVVLEFSASSTSNNYEETSQSTSSMLHNDHLIKCLKAADAIATACLRPWDPDKTAYAYFQKTYSISRFAYRSRVPSISIPLDVWRDPWHWIGLAHEIGHYAYWNLRGSRPDYQIAPISMEMVLKQRLYASLSTLFPAEVTVDTVSQLWEQKIELLKLWYAWLEEIFADLYGALCFGTAYIESLIAWLAPQLDADNLYETEDDHPAGVLRPLMQIAVLREQANKLNTPKDSPLYADLDQLNTAWLDYVKQIRSPQSGPDDPLEFTIGSLPSALIHEAINATADAVIGALETVLDQTKLQGFVPYTDSIHQRICTAAAQLASGELPKVENAYMLPVAWYAWSTKGADESHIRTWALKSYTPSDFSFSQTSVDQRPFINNLVNELQAIFGNTAELPVPQFVRDVLDDRKASQLKSKYSDKQDLVSDLIAVLLSTEFSTEEDAGGCWRCRRSDCPKGKPKRKTTGTVLCGTCGLYLCASN